MSTGKAILLGKVNFEGFLKRLVCLLVGSTGSQVSGRAAACCGAEGVITGCATCGLLWKTRAMFESPVGKNSENDEMWRVSGRKNHAKNPEM